MAVVTPTDRPKSVRNRCLIELFCGVVCVVTLPFWHFCWCRGFCHRTESDLFLFLLICIYVFLFQSILCSVTFYHVSLHFNEHACKYTCFRFARNLYYANRFCRVLPKSKNYSSKTCLMCIICTFEYVRCSNGTMNNTTTLILWYRLLTDLRALMNL